MDSGRGSPTAVAPLVGRWGSVVDRVRPPPCPSRLGRSEPRRGCCSRPWVRQRGMDKILSIAANLSTVRADFRPGRRGRPPAAAAVSRLDGHRHSMPEMPPIPAGRSPPARVPLHHDLTERTLLCSAFPAYERRDGSLPAGHARAPGRACRFVSVAAPPQGQRGGPLALVARKGAQPERPLRRSTRSHAVVTTTIRQGSVSYRVEMPAAFQSDRVI